MLIMFACMEMAGHDRCEFVPDVLCVYNFANSHEFKSDERGRSEERRLAQVVRGIQPYERLEQL
jgi:hypothetical protein